MIKSKRMLVFAIGLSIITAIALTGCIYGPSPVPEPEPEPVPAPSPEPAPAPEPAPVPEPEPDYETPTELPPADYELTASELITAFAENTETANAKYSGKDVRVTGYVTGMLSENSKINPYTLAFPISYSPDKLFGIVCMFDIQYESELMQLRPGDFVTIQGAVIGYEYDVLMRDCKLVK